MRKRREKSVKMGRAPCCDKDGVKKGAWTPEEDKILVDYINTNGHGTWRSLPKVAGLLRCGKSCRLRWTNYLRPDIKQSAFTSEEEQSIIKLHTVLRNKWAAIASHLPGRTDNKIKDFWNSHLRKRISNTGIDLNLETQLPFNSNMGLIKSEAPSASHVAEWESARVETEARLSIESLLLNPSLTVKLEYDYFLRMWKSEVGDSFRKIRKKTEWNLVLESQCWRDPLTPSLLLVLESQCWRDPLTPSLLQMHPMTKLARIISAARSFQTIQTRTKWVTRRIQH